MTWKITGAPGTGEDLLYSQAGTPTLDLRFASSKSLNDNVSGQNLIDFTRGGNGVGTYVGSDGLIKNSVVNLVLQSEDFSTTWGITGLLAFGSGSTVNAIASPTGNLTADLITEDTNTSSHQVVQGFTSVASTNYTFSIYLKLASGSRYARLAFGSAGMPAFTGANFDISTGAILSTTGSPSGSSITPIGNGWYRCSISQTASAASGSASVQLALLNSSQIGNYQGDGTSGIYIWGAQLEANTTTPGEYVKTTSSISGAPRFDHDPETGESLGLLIEEQRTNLLAYSEQFDDASWINSGTLITANTGSAPTGTATADTFISSVSALYKTFACTAQTYTASIFVKQIDGGSVLLQLLGGGAGLNGGVAFDFSTNNASANGTVDAFSSQEFGNGWYRIIATLTATGAASPQFRVVLGGGGSCYIWGAQLEVGAFPTSYIPTTTAAVTRNADVASITGANFSRWHSQSEGTVFVDAAIRQALNTPVLADLNDTTTTNRVSMSVTTGRLGQMFFNAAGVSQGATSTSNSLTVGEASSLTLAYAFNDCAISLNGGGIASDTTVTLPTVTNLSIGFRPTSQHLNGTISRLTYFDRRLPNATLQAITT